MKGRTGWEVDGGKGELIEGKEGRESRLRGRKEGRVDWEEGREGGGGRGSKLSMGGGREAQLTTLSTLLLSI
jgi:hypothetical protein